MLNDRRGASIVRGYATDFARGLRSSVAHRAVLVVSATSIALGIASPTTIFSIVHGLSRDLPFVEGDRIVYVTQANTRTGERDLGLTQPVLSALVHQQRSLEELAAYVDGSVSLVVAGTAAERYEGARISPSTLTTLRIRPEIGRAFTAQDARGRRDVAMISDALWRRRFGGDPSLLGQSVRVNGRLTSIIGILPPGFAFPLKDDIWQPLDLDSAAAAGATVQVFGRLRRGLTVSRADAEFAALTTRVIRDPAHPNLRVVTRVVPFKESQLEPSDFLLFRAMVLVVSLVLLVACANVANVLLAHVTARSHLYSVKAALGATRSAVIRELLGETAVIAFSGGAVGLGLATAAIHWFNLSVSDALPSFWMTVSIDAGVFAFVLSLVIIATIVAGLVPALYASRSDPAAALREHAAGVWKRSTTRAMRLLLAIEVAVSFALLVIAGVMTKGALRGNRIDVQVDPTSLLTARLDLDVIGDDATRAQIASKLVATAPATKGLAGLAFTTVLPGLSGAPIPIAMNGVTTLREEDRSRTRIAMVSPLYFDVLRVRAVQGRVLRASDDTSGMRVAVANQTFVRTHLASASPVGSRVQLLMGRDTSWLTIIGVVPDIVTVSADPTSAELLIVPQAQHPLGSVSVLATGPGGASAVARAIADLVREVSPDVPLRRLRTLNDAIMESRRTSWSLADVFAECGLAGLILTAVGVYGVTETMSRRRQRELAIRRALGASRRSVVGLVAREVALPLGVGLASGGMAALGLGPLLDGLLFGESPHDPIVFGIVGSLIAGAMVLATIRPATVVMRTSLVQTLRG
ncbi:MAG TPA: ABC transporter permease [Gemmatimonadaceae bacterium]|nr:ABC transporter permease [Gemmatimonadaceae bacterium]